MQSKFTDIDLIEQTLGGDQSAYADLVRRHQRFVFTLALRFVKNREDAEEIAQDCFVKAYKSLTQFQRQSKFSTWLYTIVYTTAMSSLRKKQLVTSSIDDEDNAVQIQSHSTDDYMHNAEKKSRSFYLNKAINQLASDDAVMITLFYNGEQSIEEIAKTIGIENNSVKVKLFRARQRLKAKLEHILKHEVNELI